MKISATSSKYNTLREPNTFPQSIANPANLYRTCRNFIRQRKVAGVLVQRKKPSPQKRRDINRTTCVTRVWSSSQPSSSDTPSAAIALTGSSGINPDSTAEPETSKLLTSTTSATWPKRLQTSLRHKDSNALDNSTLPPHATVRCHLICKKDYQNVVLHATASPPSAPPIERDSPPAGKTPLSHASVKRYKHYRSSRSRQKLLHPFRRQWAGSNSSIAPRKDRQQHSDSISLPPPVTTDTSTPPTQRS